MAVNLPPTEASGKSPPLDGATFAWIAIRLVLATLFIVLTLVAVAATLVAGIFATGLEDPRMLAGAAALFTVHSRRMIGGSVLDLCYWVTTGALARKTAITSVVDEPDKL